MTTTLHTRVYPVCPTDAFPGKNTGSSLAIIKNHRGKRLRRTASSVNPPPEHRYDHENLQSEQNRATTVPCTLLIFHLSTGPSYSGGLLSNKTKQQKLCQPGFRIEVGAVLNKKTNTRFQRYYDSSRGLLTQGRVELHTATRLQQFYC